MSEDKKPILKVKLFMKSGNIVEFYSSKVTVTENGFGQTTRMKWESIDGREKLLDVKLDDIEAITTREVNIDAE